MGLARFSNSRLFSHFVSSLNFDEKRNTRPYETQQADDSTGNIVQQCSDITILSVAHTWLDD
jgi:hypothetical protein